MTFPTGNQRGDGLLSIIRSVVCVLLVGLCLSVPSISDAAPEAEEGQLFAAWLRHLCQETRWVREDDTGPFKIVLVGKDRSKITEAISGGIASATYQIQERKVELGRVMELEDVGGDALAGAHLVVFLQIDDGDTQNIVNRLKGRDVLTVGSRSGSRDSGVMVELLKKNRRMRMTVDYARVKSCGLSMHSDFLALGERAGGPIEVLKKEDSR